MNNGVTEQQLSYHTGWTGKEETLLDLATQTHRKYIYDLFNITINLF